MVVHCLFEQSGTFKNVFKDLGFESYDYDIKNNYDQTDFQVDLFDQIFLAYCKEKTLFDNITQHDLIFAFFPCIRFSVQAQLLFSGKAYGMNKWSDIDKIGYVKQLHNDLSLLYNRFTELIIICIRKNIPLIIENPYNHQHYLFKYFPIKPSVIIPDRRDLGDCMKKPTMFYFFNLQPKDNLVFEPLSYKETKFISNLHGEDRSMIHPEFAEHFIKRYIL